VTQDFLPLGEEFFVEQRFFDEIFVFGSGTHLPDFRHKMPTASTTLAARLPPPG
jgi:hypothetical protein